MKAYTDANEIRLVKRGAMDSPSGPDPKTIITKDGFEILLTKKCVKQIGNKISRVIGKQLTRGEADELVAFIQALPSRNYIGIEYENAQNLITEQFLNRDHKNVHEYQDVYNITGIEPHPGDMREYQKKELNLMTTDENPLKYSSHHDRRGNAIIDADRVRVAHMMGDRSSANNIKAAKDVDIGEKILEVSQNTNRAIETFNRYMNAESIDEIFARSSRSWTTYQSIILPHQTIPLDSRFRLPSHNPAYEYKWYLHNSGTAGSIGDIRMKDTLKELISMKVNPFWMPVSRVNNGYYSKIRMLIHEFSAQSTESQQFLANGDIKIQEYHFELLVTQQSFGRFYLEPTNDGIFKFRKPFARPESITISFTDPFNVIIPPADYMSASVTPTNPAVFTTNIPTELATGDIVYIQNFVSTNTQLNVAVNRERGYIATRLGTNSFSIPVDLSSLPSTITNTLVYIGSKRLIIPIEFTSLEQ